MTKVGDGGPAFPRSGVKDGYGKVVGDASGMSLREWVMGKCVAAAFGGADYPLKVADGETWEDAQRRHWANVAAAAAIAADAMIAARGAK